DSLESGPYHGYCRYCGGKRFGTVPGRSLRLLNRIEVSLGVRPPSAKKVAFLYQAIKSRRVGRAQRIPPRPCPIITPAKSSELFFWAEVVSMVLWEQCGNWARWVSPLALPTV